jgi:hypothetical protein
VDLRKVSCGWFADAKKIDGVSIAKSDRNCRCAEASCWVCRPRFTELNSAQHLSGFYRHWGLGRSLCWDTLQWKIGM